MTLDLRHFQTVRALHVYLAWALDLPEYYGGNLDALYDCLCEMPQERKFTLICDEMPSPEMAAYLPKLLRVFEDADRLA